MRKAKEFEYEESKMSLNMRKAKESEYEESKMSLNMRKDGVHHWVDEIHFVGVRLPLELALALQHLAPSPDIPVSFFTGRSLHQGRWCMVQW
jgi:hypothetical protein